MTNWKTATQAMNYSQAERYAREIRINHGAVILPCSPGYYIQVTDQDTLEILGQIHTREHFNQYQEDTRQEQEIEDNDDSGDYDGNEETRHSILGHLLNNS